MNKKILILMTILAMFAIYAYSPTITGDGFDSLTPGSSGIVGDIKIVEGNPFSSSAFTTTAPGSLVLNPNPFTKGTDTKLIISFKADEEYPKGYDAFIMKKSTTLMTELATIPNWETLIVEKLVSSTAKIEKDATISPQIAADKLKDVENGKRLVFVRLNKDSGEKFISASLEVRSKGEPVPVTVNKPLLKPLATISKSLVDDLSE